MAPRLPRDHGLAPHDEGLGTSLSTQGLRWSSLRRLPRPARWLLRLAVLTGLYALFGYQLLPIIVRHQAVSYVREQYGRELRVGELHIDPFRLAIDIRDLALPDADGQLMVGFQQLTVNFQAFASLWQRAYVFHRIALHAPKVRAVLRPDGSLNFDDLQSHRTQPAARKQAQPAPALAIDDLRVTDGVLDFLERGRPQPFSQRFAPISFALHGFRTTAQGGEFSLSAQSAPAQRFWWQGSIALSPQLASNGRFAISRVPAALAADYLGDAVPFDIADGEVAIAGSYQVQLSTPLQARAQLSGIKVDHLAMHARGAPADRVSLAGLMISDTKFDLARREVEIGHIDLRDLRTNVVLEHDGTVNLARLVSAGRQAKERATVAAQQTPQVAPALESKWQAALHGLTLSGALHFEDRAIEPPVQVHVSALELGARELTLEPAKAIPFHLQLALDDHSALRVNGHVTQTPFSANIAVALEQLRLTRAQPYVQPFADLTIHDGVLDFHGRVSLTSMQGAPRVEVNGDARVDDLRTTDNLLKQPFVDLGRLELRQVAFHQEPRSVEIAEVLLRKPFARLVLSNQQVLNVTSILHGGKPASEPQKTAPTKMSDAHPLAQAEVPDASVKIDAVRIDDMRLSFTDHFIKPNFSAEIHGLHGKLQGLSSDRGALASLNLTGQLGASAPVTITGRLRPFAYAQQSDIEMSWSNVPLPVFNPYSDRFTGWNIVTGDLATKLHYRVRNGKLDAQHHIRVDQLTWGKATDTKQEASLPVRLATAMLRDRNGVINLDIPVQGSLNDPSFKVGPLLWQAVKNVVIKAATAPFDWLGSLFQGAEKARFVDFAPGEATVSSEDKKELAALASALVERPSLHVDVPLGVDATLDRQALRERRYQHELALTIHDELWGSKKDTPYAQLDVGDRSEVLAALYQRLTNEKPKLPDAPDSEGSWRQRRAARKAFALAQLEKLTLAAIQVAPEDLEQLGLRRANAIERALTADGKVDSTRVLVSNQGSVKAEQGKVRFELGLQ